MHFTPTSGSSGRVLLANIADAHAARQLASMAEPKPKEGGGVSIFLTIPKFNDTVYIKSPFKSEVCGAGPACA